MYSVESFKIFLTNCYTDDVAQKKCSLHLHISLPEQARILIFSKKFPNMKHQTLSTNIFRVSPEKLPSAIEFVNCISYGCQIRTRHTWTQRRITSECYCVLGYGNLHCCREVRTSEMDPLCSKIKEKIKARGSSVNLVPLQKPTRHYQRFERNLS